MSTPDLLVVAGDLDPRRGGQERSIREVLTELDRLGAHVALASPSRPEDIPLARHITLPVRSGSKMERWKALLGAADEAGASTPAGCVLSHLPTRCDWYLPRGGLFPEAYARSAASHSSALGRWSSTLVTSRHRKLLLNKERHLLAAGSRTGLIALSDYVAASARQLYHLPEDRLRVIRNGIDIDRVRDARPIDRATLGLDAGHLVIMAVAHNPRLKGTPSLLAAVRSLDRDDVRVVLIGGEPSNAGPVIGLGPRNDVPSLLRCADLFVHPTFYDPSSRVVLEALAARVPVITTRWNGAADVIDGGGLVVDDPRDTPALRDAIATMLERGTREAARASLRKIDPLISVEAHARSLLGLVERG